MKRYFYHVSYFWLYEGEGTLADTIIDTPEPIKTEEAINRVREVIQAGYGVRGPVGLLGFQLLRIENVEPEEVATP